MQIDNNTIKYIADLAMVELLHEEEEKYSQALGQILTYTEVLNDLDLEKADALPEFSPAVNRFREDTVVPPAPRELLMSNSKSVAGGMFRIPKVVEDAT
jgi:aspartyl/glutamyl-tRNA(Asn/Gln) amidotransferase C subunit